MDESRRRELARTMTEPSKFEDVVEAITAFGQHRHAKVYVERQGGKYRWSPAHAGGSYPLLRVFAQFLEIPHTSVIVPFTTVDGWTLVSPEGARMTPAAFTAWQREHDVTWAFIPASADGIAVAAEIESKLSVGESGLSDAHGAPRSHTAGHRSWP